MTNYEDEVDAKVQAFIRTHPAAFMSQVVYATKIPLQDIKEALNRLWVSRDM